MLVSAGGSADDMPENWTEYASEAIELLKDAALPTNGGELLSIFVSESFAGFISGLSFRLVSSVLGDRQANRDTSILQGTTAGAYFGVRGAVRNIAEVLGIPRPIAAVIAGFTASVLSEEIKIVGREIGDSQRPKEVQDIIQENNVFESAVVNNTTAVKKPLISIPELSQDLTKWVAYDLLIPEDGHSPFTAAVCGLASGLIAHSIYEILLPSTRAIISGEQLFPSTEYLKIANRFLQAGLEASALFTAYETSTLAFKYYLPSEISNVLSENFNDFLSNPSSS
jgi:hypothetical protein